MFAGNVSYVFSQKVITIMKLVFAVEGVAVCLNCSELRIRFLATYHRSLEERSSRRTDRGTGEKNQFFA